MSNLIVKHNDFIEGRFHLELNQAKIIAKLSSIIQKDDKDFKLYIFQAKNLLEELKMGINNYDDLKKSVDSLVDKTIQLGKPDSTLTISLLSSAEYFKDGRIELEFSPKLKPYLLQLKENFTKYQLENVLSLSSFYAIRIYELCKQYEKIKERIIEVEKLKEILKIQDKYKLYGHFKKKVLDIAKREINEKTDINISFEEIKTGRKITSIKFLIEKKEKEIEKVENKIDFEIEDIDKFKDLEDIKYFEDIPKPIKKKTVKTNKEYSEEVLNLYNLLPLEEQIESSKEKLENLLKDHTFKYIEADIKYAKKSKVKNYWAFLLKSCKEGHYSKDELEKAKIPAEEKNIKLKKTKEMIEKVEEDKLKIEEQNKLREKALEFYEKLDKSIQEKIKEKAKELYIQEGQIKDFNPMIKKIYQTTLEKFYIHRIMRENFKGLLEI